MNSPSGVQPPSGLSYISPQVFVVGHAITSVNPQVTGTVTNYKVSPTLPAGLTLNATTGVISGTPTAISGAANYTVTAANDAGSTTTTVSIAVTDATPSIRYPSGTLSFTVGVKAQPIMASNTGGGVISWSISPGLPPGLSFVTSSGAILGKPTAAVAKAAYTVTAQNSGGSSTFDLKIVVEAAPLLDLGHADTIQQLHADGARLLSLDETGHWVLWNSSTATELSSGDIATIVLAADLAGPTGVIQVEPPSGGGTLQVIASSDGNSISVINTLPSWWKLSSDGSYICAGDSSGLKVWSPSGQVITTRAGDYSAAKAFAAPGEVRIVAGPAGTNVVEAISVPAGTSSVSPSFQGQFSSWFQDGERFLSSLSNTVWVYSKGAAQQDMVAVGTTHLGGEGNWFWSVGSDGKLNIYAVGASSSPAATYVIPPNIGVFVASGTTLAVEGWGNPSPSGPPVISVVDLSGGTPAKTDYTLPIASPSAYAAVSGTQWFTGNVWGALLDGASLAGTPTYFGYGRAWSIAGSPGRLAVATASGRILYIDASTSALLGTIKSPSTQVVLSTDGSLLAAAEDANDVPYFNDLSLNIYSLPSQTVVDTFPYTYGSGSVPSNITLSGSGTALGQTLNDGRLVTAVPGGGTIYSDHLGALPVRLSPDGTLIAVSDQDPNPSTTTQILKNGARVTSVPGWAVGWIDDNHLLANTYVQHDRMPTTYAGCAIYDATGQKLTCPATLPEIRDFQTVTSDSIYGPDTNTIFSVTNGVPTWMSGSPTRGAGAVAGSRVVFASGARVLAESY